MTLSQLASKRTVVRGQEFDGCELHDQNVRANFVECTFNSCQFTRLRSEDTFWGASSRWNNCTFSDCDCSGLISPQNRFEDCAFINFVFTRYNPCDTTFINTTFHKVRFTALKAQPNCRNTTIRQQIAKLWPYPEITELDTRRASVLFRECKFVLPRFHRAYFNQMVFDSCDIQLPEFIGCSFAGIQNLQDQWWAEDNESDPERQYVIEIHQKLRESIGQSSTAFKLSQEWLNQAPLSSSHADWYDYLLDNGIPENECDVVERLLEETPTV